VKRASRSLAVCSLFLSGCFHSALVEEKQRALVKEGLAQQVFPMSLDAARQGVTDSREAVCAARLADAEGWAKVSMPHVDVPKDFKEACLRFDKEALQADRWHFCLQTGCCWTLITEGTGIRIDETTSERGDVRLCEEEIWKTLAPGTAEAALESAAVAAEEHANQFERDFKGPWAFTVGLYGSLRTPPLGGGLGAQAGVRKWISPFLIPAMTVGYEYTGDHVVALTPRIEVTTWTRSAEQHGLPQWSIYLFASGLVIIRTNASVRPGLRVGVGFQALFAMIELGALVTETGPAFRMAVGVGL
jgi:hypothetical protein